MQTEYPDYFKKSHQLLRESIRSFVEQEIKPHIDQWERAGEFPRELYQKAGDIGFLGLGYPEEYGGTSGDGFHKIAATEELMQAGSGGLVASLGSHDIGLPPIVKWGTARAADRIVPEVLAGEKISALAITEAGGGSDVANLKTRAVRDGDHYVVNGSKTFITSGIRADYYTVAVRTGDEGYGGISLLLIEKGTPGFRVGRKLDKMGWRCSDTAELFLTIVECRGENLVGCENGGFACIMSNFQQERLFLSLMALCTAQLALDEALAYSRERQAFGRSISGFQVTRHKLADMATQVEAAREFVYRVAAKMEAGQNQIREVSMLKNFTTDVADKLTYDAVQLFGGAGYMEGSLVERLYRDNRILSIGGGTREIMNEIIAKQMSL